MAKPISYQYIVYLPPFPNSLHWHLISIIISQSLQRAIPQDLQENAVKSGTWPVRSKKTSHRHTKLFSESVISPSIWIRKTTATPWTKISEELTRQRTYISAWMRATTMRAARYQAYLCIMCGHDFQFTKATRIDTPEQSKPQIKNDYGTTEPQRWKALNGAIPLKHQEEAAIRPSSAEMLREVKPPDNKRRVRFEGEIPCRPKPKRQVSQGTMRENQEDLSKHGIPIAPPIMKGKGILKKPAKEISVVDTSITATTDDCWQSSDEDEDMIIEGNPLRNYPAVDDSTFLERMEVPTRAQPGRSLLAKQLARNTVRYTVAGEKALEKQRWTTQMAIEEAQKWEATGRESGLLRPYMPEAGQGWGFEQPDLLGPAVVRGYGNRP
ncbi:hypothetical protein RRF57_012918 [Xylaria bambusicola]|uniref:Uncharacterized protein n=1 Tax=Xylaria bambusicola TaxID=326684 RepID=A0AAN7ZDY3_9PEZI